MTRLRWLLVLAALLPSAFALGQESTASELRESFAGVWTLVSFESFDDSGAVTLRPMSGRIVYDRVGNMAAQLMPDGYAEGARDPELAQQRRGYVAYFGRYELDPERGAVSHHVAGSLIPRWIGTELVRYFEIDGDLLRLSLRDADGRTTGTLTWRRLRGPE